MKKINVVHFGIAHDHSPWVLEAARRYPDVFDVVGICEPDEKIRNRFGNHPSYDGLPFISENELYRRNDINAVFCESQELRSVSDAQRCMEHGLHVHLDKPGGIELKSFEKLAEFADKKNLTLHMGYMYRYNPAMKYVREAVQLGRLGKITGIDASFSIQHSAVKREWLSQFPGGMMFYLGCHSIDMILQILGEPERVVSFNHSSGNDDINSYDTSFSVLDYSGCACSVRANATEANGYYKRTLKVVGTKGSIEIQPLETPTIVREAMIKDGENNPWHDYSYSVFPGYPNGRYDDMMLEFAACVRGEITNPYSLQYEVAVQKTLLKACGVQI